MKNIFSDIKDYVKQPNRNVFDMSFQNNATFNFGTLYPVFCKEVIPGDSVSIDTTFALRFLPMAFPVQTKVQANLHFFYVRNRNLWENWKKFITHTDDVEFPVLDGSQSCLTTGGLADYLGIPTTLVGNYSITTNYSEHSFLFQFTGSSFGINYTSFVVSDDTFKDVSFNRSVLGSSLSSYALAPTHSGPDQHYLISFALNNVSFNYIPSSFTLEYGNSLSNLSASNVYQVVLTYKKGSINFIFAYCNFTPVIDGNDFKINIPLDGWEFIDGNKTESFDSYSSLLSRILQYTDNSEFSFSFGCVSSTTSQGSNSFHIALKNNGEYPTNWGYYQLRVISVPSSYSSEVTDLNDVVSIKNPFLSTNPINIPISALPFRAYESIYNSFYRNELNDPLFVNGKPTYDVYCPNTSDGVDDYDYKLYNRNWELDFLTSAVQSPQQGIAPLVGVSSAGNFTFVNKDSNGNVGYFTADAQFSADGTTITGFKLSDKVQLSGIPTTDVGNVPEDIKRGTIYNLNQMALAGISINDFRNVNALQRWLETNIRRGYKYRDQIKSHFGVDVSYQELDMPEFIGGISEPVFVNQVNQTTETDSDPLGSYAGQMSLLASSNHTIRHYADEHGFIMGIMSITPVPNYSQLLPKHFIKYNYLDYFFPEFGHIGMQPVDYREVCPLQAYGVNPLDVNNTFGYQRAWYDYIASVDEVHGLFRTNLRNFVLNRQFDTLPKLNKDFLQVDANQLNDIFTVQDISDKILGQIKFNCIFKRPIPKYGIPRLE